MESTEKKEENKVKVEVENNVSNLLNMKYGKKEEEEPPLEQGL